MKRRTLPVAAAALCLALIAPVAAPLQAQVAPAPSGRVIVKFKANAPSLRKSSLSAGEQRAERARSLAQRTGLVLAAGNAVGERGQVVTGSGLGSEALAARLALDADVEYAVPDRRKRIVAVPLPNDPLYAASGSISPAVGQWYLRAPEGVVATTAMTNVASIDAEAAWNLTMGNPAIVVAVLDTGVRFEHPDLKKVENGGNFLAGYDFVSNMTAGNDGDGRDGDPSDPGDWLTSSEASQIPECPSGTTQATSSWHGTETSALIGALTNNGEGMASVGRNVRILPVRVLGKCGGLDSDILDGMRWAAGIHVDGVPDNGTPAKVINMSLGGDSACSQAYRDAIAEVNARGAVVVVSAGNSSGHKVGEPANCPGALGVAGLRNIGNKVGYSDLGPEVSVSAPAGNCINETGPCLFPILTARNGGLQAPTGISTYSTSTSSPSVGTSFAAPLVAGTAALMLSANPTLTAQQLKLLLQASARPFPSTGGDPGGLQCTAPQYDTNNDPIDQVQCYCNTGVCGAGMLDAGAAVTAATSGTLTVVRARIDPSPARAVASQTVTLRATNSDVLSGRVITSYQWTVVDGGGIVTGLTGATVPTATVVPTGPGTFTVRLTVTDNANTTSSSTMSILVADAPAVVTPPPTTSSGGGGGGAASPAWLLALLGAIALLRSADRRRH